MQQHGLFGPGSMTWRISSEAVLNLGGARAVLMQLAHPLVALGVSEHSRYMRDPLGRAEHTFMLGQMLTFGDNQTVRDAARTINRLHTHVAGMLAAQVGAYAAGTGYRARDHELLLWVYATLIDTVFLTYPLFVGPLSIEEQERYYQESQSLVQLLGLPASKLPPNAAALQAYVAEMVHSDRLAATSEARRLVRRVLYPPVSDALRPLMHLHLQLTTGLLPQTVRDIYGLAWDSRRQRLFELSTAMMRRTIPRLPTPLRILPITRKMMGSGCSAEHIEHIADAARSSFC